MNFALRCLVLCFGVAAVLLPAFGQERDQAPAGGTPGEMTVVERSDDPASGSYAILRGQIRVKGVLAIEFDRVPGNLESQDGENPESKDIDPALFFIPDASEFSKVARAIGVFYPSSPMVIDLMRDFNQVLKAVLGEARAHLIVSGNMPHYEVPAEIVIREMRTDVECNHRSFGAMEFDVTALSTTVAEGAQARFIGC